MDRFRRSRYVREREGGREGKVGVYAHIQSVWFRVPAADGLTKHFGPSPRIVQPSTVLQHSKTVYQTNPAKRNLFLVTVFTIV